MIITIKKFSKFLKLSMKLKDKAGHQSVLVQRTPKAQCKRTQHCWMLHVASVCTLCCMLLDVVAQSLKPVTLFSQQLPTFLLFCDRRRVAQQCWIRLHSSSYIVSLRGRRSKGKGKGIRARDHALARKFPLPFPVLTPATQAKHCWNHARSLRMVYKDLWVVSFPRCTAGPNIVGSCCIRLHTTANMHATTPNIVGATMLGVVASVCTQPKNVCVEGH